MTDAPRIRAGHDDRSQITELLAEAYAQGKLDREEFDERSAQVMATRFIDELGPLVADLGGSQQMVVATTSAALVDGGAADSLTRLDRTAHSSNLSVAVFSGHERTGRWVVGRNHVSVAIMGGNTIDLRQVVHTADEIVIDAFAVMGGTEVIVAEDADVVVDGFGFMGGFGWDKRKHAQSPSRPTGPRIRVRGFAFWGGVGVVRKPLDD